MKVKIKLFASLRQFGPEEQVVDLPENATVDDVVTSLNLPKMALLKIVNGEHRPSHYHLKDGDELALFPPIAGGQPEATDIPLTLCSHKKNVLLS